MTRATVFSEMTFTEFLTIYLAIGAPFGAYYFLKKRLKDPNLFLILKSVAVTLIWFVFAARLIKYHLLLIQNTQSNANLDFLRGSKIEAASQNLQKAYAKLPSCKASISFFEFRETLERYIGLTLAVQSSSLSSPAPEHELEIFRIAGFEKGDLQLAGKLFHRKNYSRLHHHQERARRDFLAIYQLLKENLGTELNSKPGAWQEYQTEALCLSELLVDIEAIRILQKSNQLPFAQQSPITESNGDQEQDLWKILQPSAAIKTFPDTTSIKLMMTRRSRN